MEKTNNKHLAIGSVVLLKEGTQKLMIVGFCPIVEDTVYDYAAVAYPEGITTKKRMFFNYEDIETVCHYGYVDDEEIKYMKKLSDISSEL